MTGRRSARPSVPWQVRVRDAVLRWAGRLALGALAGAVVAGATTWAGASWPSARLLGIGAAAVAVLAATLAATLPPGPVGSDREPPAPPASDAR